MKRAMKNSRLFKFIIVIFVFHVFMVYFAVNETLDFKTRAAKTINVVVIDSRRSFLMPNDRLVYEKNTGEGNDQDINKGKVIYK